MFKFLATVAAAVVLAIAGTSAYSEHAIARQGELEAQAAAPIVMAADFPPPNQQVYPGSGPSIPIVAKVAATSTFTWQAVDSFGWAAWRDIVARSLNSDSDDPLALGRVINDFLASEGLGRITIREAAPGEAPDQKLYAVGSSFLAGQCGNWATACDFLFNPLPIPSYFNGATMSTWAYGSQAPVVRHEVCHSICQACDQYVGGCPPTSNQAVACTGNLRTLMDCGGAARTLTFFDYTTFKRAYPATAGFLQAFDCGDPCWRDGLGGYRWRFSNGLSFTPNDGCGLWYTASNRLWWGDCDYSWGGRWNDILRLWIGKDRAFDPATGEFHMFTGFVPGLF